MEFPKDLKRVECPEPVEGLTWVYILLMRNDMLYVGQSKNVSNPSFSAIRRASLVHGRPKELKIKTSYGISQRLKARRMP